MNAMLGLQDKLALQKAAAETKDGAVKGLSAANAHVDLQDDQVIWQTPLLTLLSDSHHSNVK